MGDKRKVDLTDEQIAFLRESLKYSKRNFRDYDYSPADPEWARTHRNEQIAMAESVEQALRDAR